MTLLAIITLAAVLLMGVSHLIALRTERPRSLIAPLESAPLYIHRPKRG
ncbi:hypothetical protein ACLE20_01490 [Rhizobium sp. YIM 134829]